MSLPAGVTRIPRRSITSTAFDSFVLANRLTNSSAGDLANPGNCWRSNNAKNRRQSTVLESVLDSGEFMAKVIGRDCRAWIRGGSGTFAAAQNCLRPNSVYFYSGGSPITMTFSKNGIFQVGDRVTFITTGSSQVTVILSDTPTLITPSGSAFTTIVLSTSNNGVGVTLEYGLRDATNAAPVYCWYLVAFNGVLGSTITIS